MTTYYYDAEYFENISEEEIVGLSDEQLLLYAWKEQGAVVLDAIKAQKIIPMTIEVFLSHCYSCGGSWSAMFLTGINKLYPDVFNALPDDMGKYAWWCLHSVLSLLKVLTSSSDNKRHSIKPEETRYDTYDYLSHVKEPDSEELAQIERVFREDVLNRGTDDTSDYDSDSSFSHIEDISNCLFDFSRTQSGKKRRRENMSTASGLDFDKLALSKRTQNFLGKIGIYSVSSLITESRKSLRETKTIGAKSIDEITDKLLKFNLHLEDDAIYECAKCGRKFCDMLDDCTEHFCRICAAKMERVEMISDITVTLSQPQYGSYTNISSGFTVYANITNNTEKPQKIKLADFYLVTDGQQRAPESFLTGYVFNDETVLPMTSRSCGKIWSLRTLGRTHLTNGDYSVITLVMNGTSYMFKFVYKESGWEIDDYYEE